LLNFAARNLGGADCFRPVSEYRLTDLHNLQSHTLRMSLPVSHRPLHRTLVNSAMPTDSNLAERLSREPRWPAIIAVLAIAVLYRSLPERLTPGPSWLLLVAVAALLIPTIAAFAARAPRVLGTRPIACGGRDSRRGARCGSLAAHNRI